MRGTAATCKAGTCPHGLNARVRRLRAVTTYTHPNVYRPVSAAALVRSQAKHQPSGSWKCGHTWCRPTYLAVKNTNGIVHEVVALTQLQSLHMVHHLHTAQPPATPLLAVYLCNLSSLCSQLEVHVSGIEGLQWQPLQARAAQSCHSGSLAAVSVWLPACQVKRLVHQPAALVKWWHAAAARNRHRHLRP